MMFAEITVDLPPMTASEIAAWVGVITIVVPALVSLVILLLGRVFVTNKQYSADRKKWEENRELHEKQLMERHNLILANLTEHQMGMAQIRETAQREESKTDALGREIKTLGEAVKEHSKITKENTTVTQALSVEMAVVKDRIIRNEN